jgi:hypothetical protein
MDALVGGEVKGTVSRSSGFGLPLPRAQADQASGQDLANLGQALGGGHQVGVEGIAHACYIPARASNCRVGSEDVIERRNECVPVHIPILWFRLYPIIAMIGLFHLV